MKQISKEVAEDLVSKLIVIRGCLMENNNKLIVYFHPENEEKLKNLQEAENQIQNVRNEEHTFYELIDREATLSGNVSVSNAEDLTSEFGQIR